jgi:hypothetical protein
VLNSALARSDPEGSVSSLCAVGSLHHGSAGIIGQSLRFSETPHEIHLWQGTGLFITLLGVGYGLASTDPRKHWGIVLIGLLAKVFGATGLCWSVLAGQVSSHLLWLVPFNDVIWFWPFWRVVRDGMTSNARPVD